MQPLTLSHKPKGLGKVKGLIQPLYQMLVVIHSSAFFTWLEEETRSGNYFLCWMENVTLVFTQSVSDCFKLKLSSPSEIFSPESAGSRKTSRARVEMRTQGISRLSPQQSVLLLITTVKVTSGYGSLQQSQKRSFLRPGTSAHKATVIFTLCFWLDVDVDVDVYLH